MARSKEQNERMREEKKSLIQKVALRQFAEKGLYATKIKDIADGVGMAQGLLYNYYKSKEEIYIELINHALDRMVAAVDSLNSLNIPVHEKIKQSITEMIKIIKNCDDFNQTCRLISQASSSSEIPQEVRMLISEKRDYPYQVISRIIKEGQSEGTVIDGDPEQLAILFWTIIIGLAVYIDSRNDLSKFPDADLITNFFLKDKK